MQSKIDSSISSRMTAEDELINLPYHHGGRKAMRSVALRANEIRLDYSQNTSPKLFGAVEPLAPKIHLYIRNQSV